MVSFWLLVSVMVVCSDGLWEIVCIVCIGWVSVRLVRFIVWVGFFLIRLSISVVVFNFR